MKLVEQNKSKVTESLHSLPIGAIFKFSQQLCVKIWSNGADTKFVSLENPKSTWDFPAEHAKVTFVEALPKGTILTFEVQ
jgi:hypothetical protein